MIFYSMEIVAYICKTLNVNVKPWACAGMYRLGPSGGTPCENKPESYEIFFACAPDEEFSSK